jgi:hypothetical protein
MYKISFGVLSLILAVIVGNAMVVTGSNAVEEMCIPMGPILLEPPEGVEPQRPPVNFSHPAHFNFNCLTCHHQWEMDEPIVSCTTSGCHDGVESPIKAGQGKVDEDLLIAYYKTAFHKMCISCHREMKAQNKKMELSGRVLKDKLPNPGPTSCKGCHVEEE